MEQLPLFTLGDGESKLCTIPDFAKAHDVPVQTLYSATATGRILHVRIGGRLYLNAESAEKYMIMYRKYNTREK